MPENLKDCLCILTKYPVPGEAKTRLIPALGAEDAARLHRRLTEHIVAIARKVNCTVVICCAGEKMKKFRAWLGNDLIYVPQAKGNLGSRLCYGFQWAFKNGFQRVIAIGADIPDISGDILREAFQGLDTRETVLGPAEDGGYYLLGMRNLHPEIFRNIDWGTENVARQTKEAIGRMELSLLELPVLTDIDCPDDLKKIYQVKKYSDILAHPTEISVIIPTLNEENEIAQTLEHAQKAENIEIIVADGGSTDKTIKIARQFDVRVLEVPGGRARQMNAGAAHAQGRILLFLHADTQLPGNYAEKIRKTMESPHVVAGAFRFSTEDDRPLMRLMEWGTNLRARYLRMPYGDQGLFLEKRIFDEMNGYQQLPIMEDFEIIRRLGKRGTLKILPDKVITSARRWKEYGILCTMCINQVVVLGFLAGISIQTLFTIYQKSKK